MTSVISLLPLESLYLLLLLLAVYIFRKPILSIFIPRSIPGIPAYPDPQPFLGDIARFAKVMKATKSFSAFFDQCAKDLGPISQVRLSFLETIVVLTDYQEIETILTRRVKQFDRAGNTISVFRTILPLGQIALPTNEMWKHHRRIIGTAMTSKYLSLTTPRANEVVRQLIGLWKVKMVKSGGKSFKGNSDFEGATMDAICGMAFGHTWGCIKGFTEQVEEMSDISTGSVGEAIFKTELPVLAKCTWTIFNSVPTFSTFPALSHFLTRLTPKYRRDAGIIDQFLVDKLAEARIRAKERGGEAAADMADNTLDMMVARELRGEDWMTDAEMKQEVFQYLVAGAETTSVTLSWFVKYMTNHPDIQHKLRAHVLSRLPEIQDRQPTYEDLNATTMPYLEAVIYESLRMSRTAGGYTREVTEDCVVLGKVLPKGTTLLMPTVTGYEDRSTPVAYFSQSSPTPSSPTTSTDLEDDSASVKLATSLNPVRFEKTQRKVGYWAPKTGLIFDPERWLDENGNFNANAGPSIPFSLGQRGCFGKNLAMLELRLFISQLNHHFFFAPVLESQNSFANFETVANHPVQCFIRPLSWESMEACAGKGLSE